MLFNFRWPIWPPIRPPRWPRMSKSLKSNVLRNISRTIRFLYTFLVGRPEHLFLTSVTEWLSKWLKILRYRDTLYLKMEISCNIPLNLLLFPLSSRKYVNNWTILHLKQWSVYDGMYNYNLTWIFLHPVPSCHLLGSWSVKYWSLCLLVSPSHSNLLLF